MKKSIPVRDALFHDSAAIHRASAFNVFSSTTQRSRYPVRASASLVPVTGLDCLGFASYGAARSSPRRRRSSAPHLDGFESLLGSKNKREAEASLLFLVPVTGLEPVRCRQRRILSPLRLPFHHTGRCSYSIVQFPEKSKRKVPFFSGDRKNALTSLPGFFIMDYITIRSCGRKAG